MDNDVKNVSIPWAYAELLYHLRVHINYVRQKLESQHTARESSEGQT